MVAAVWMAQALPKTPEEIQGNEKKSVKVPNISLCAYVSSPPISSALIPFPSFNQVPLKATNDTKKDSMRGGTNHRPTDWLLTRVGGLRSLGVGVGVGRPRSTTHSETEGFGMSTWHGREKTRCVCPVVVRRVTTGDAGDSFKYTSFWWTKTRAAASPGTQAACCSAGCPSRAGKGVTETMCLQD
ncbi:hypothetical protein E2C01_047998 [Portunus trituberculatus]|uniref:Uncharacterized protein n=1 Tax=Portunus trituberculatus TaxID=210409 RepID=A0A5B7G2I7_PORTR|nr:hypothetical protein [Portunus trituberculatus]